MINNLKKLHLQKTTILSYMKKVFLIFVLFFSVQSFSQLKNAKKYAKTITADDLKEHLYIYASDEFEGRNTGS